MAEALQPDTMAATIADMQRRLQILEATARVGLNRIRYAWGTYTPPIRQTAGNGVWESGPAGTTWQDDQGNTGTGYPQVTVTTGKKILVLMQCIGLDLANDVGYQSFSLLAGVGIDGGNPGVSAGWSAIKPLMQRYTTHGATSEGTSATALLTGRADINPGSHTIKMWGFWTGAGGALAAYMADPFIAVIPID